MTTTPSPTTTTSIDPAFIAEIVRRVLARVRASHANVTITKLVTVETVLSAVANQQQIIISAKSVVTPAAREEAKRLGVRIETHGVPSTDSLSTTTSLGMIDTTATPWVESVIAGLARRGISVTAGYAVKLIVLTDEPALQTYHYSSSGKHRAAMLSELAQVVRFQGELSPDVWVIDKTQMNLPTIINAVAHISRFGGAHP